MVPPGLLVVLAPWVLPSLGVDIIGGEGGNMGPLGEGKEKLLSGGNVWGSTTVQKIITLCHFNIALCIC